jgi:hypothetical protein
VAKPRYRWRAPTKIVTRKRDPLGALVDGRRSGSNKPSPLTREREKRSSVLRAEPGPRTEPSAGCDRERQRSFANVARGRKRRGEVAPLSSGSLRLELPRNGKHEESGRMDRSWGPRRQARSTWGWVAERRAGAAVADELRLGWWPRSARRKPRARESRDPRVLVS